LRTGKPRALGENGGKSQLNNEVDEKVDKKFSHHTPKHDAASFDEQDPNQLLITTAEQPQL
jgi:hypothetical protein